MRLGLDADGVLTTTRSVRKRLDLEKPVEREVVEECLEIALQAPTGSNTQGWQWVFITDPDKKRVIADFYGANYDAYTNRPDQPNYGDDDPRTSQRPKIMDSSRYLREIFHEVPFTALKVTTDLVDGEITTEEEFVTNLQYASNRLSEGILSLVHELKDFRTE